MSLNQGTFNDVTLQGPGPFGFRLAGGKDFGLPLHISKITPGSKADRAQLREKDVILMINGEDIATCTHLDAQNKIKAAFHDDLHLKTQRGDTRVWNPISKDDSGSYKVSLKANNNQQEFMHPGSKSNFAPRGYGSPQPSGPSPIRSVAPPAPGQGSANVVHLQFNSPAGLYSEQNIAETFKGQTEGMIDDSVGNGDDSQPQPYQPLRDTGFGPKPGETSATMIEPEEGQEIKYSGYINPGSQSRSFKMLQAMVEVDGGGEAPVENNYPQPIATETQPSLNGGGAVAHQAAPVTTRPVGVRSVKPPGPSRPQATSPSSQQVRDLPNCAVCQSNIMPPQHTPSYSQPPARSPQTYSSSSPQAYSSPSNYAPPPPPPPQAVSRPQPPAPSRPRAPQAAPANRARPAAAPQQAPKGGDQYCDGCRQIIKGTVVTALGKSFHPDHFVCAHCHDNLKNQGFVEHDNKVYCQTDYNKLYAPKCFQCGQSVAGNCVTAMGRSYHPEHFVCVECKTPIGDQQFMVNNGQPYCRKDHEALFSHRCASCNFTIDAGDPWVEAMDKCYHSNCFNCSICQTPLEGQKFYAKSGRPVCQTHAYA